MPSVSTETEEEEVKEEVNLMIENKSLKRNKKRGREELDCFSVIYFF